MTDYSKQYPTIQSAFKDGIETIFGTLFTDSVYLYLLDSVNTTPNIYDEAIEKVYLAPIKLVGGIKLQANISNDPITIIEKDMVIKIPTKQLIQNNIAYETEADLETLRKAKLVYKDVEYFVDNIRPITFVADMWHLYAFECSKAVNAESP